MIRPITVICWILALGAGLYLYRAKHEVELMDKHIEQIAKETSDIRTESRRLLDDWIRLGEPEQLHKYSDEYLGLKTIAPTQFARVSDLATRLPAPQADPPDEIEAVVQSSAVPPAGEPPASTQADAATTDTTDEADGGDLPVPPIPPTTPLLTTVSLPGVTAIPLQARPVSPRLANVQSDDRPRANPEPRVTDEPRAVTLKPLPTVVTEPRQAAPGPANGQAVQREHELPPLQAQTGPAQGGYVPAQSGKTPSPPHELQARASPPPIQHAGLPPLQAQGASQPQNPGQPLGRTIPWSTETHVADSGANDPRREVRPAQPQPGPAQPPFGDPRGPQAMRQAPVPAATGSLLGTSRGPVPLPLPAPTPVNATWPGQAR